MSKRADQIIEQLPSLSAPELRNIISRARFFLQMSTVGERDPWPDHVIDVILDVMRGKGLEYRSRDAMRASSSFASFKDKLEVLRPYFDKISDKKALREGALRLGIEMLIEDLSRMRLPVDGPHVMRHIHRIPSVIDSGFPGYWASGILSIVLSDDRVTAIEEYNRDHPME